MVYGIIEKLQRSQRGDHPMDIQELREWLKQATLANIVAIDDSDSRIYDRIPLIGTVTMKNDIATVNQAACVCEAVIYSPSNGMLLVRSTVVDTGHGGKKRQQVRYFAELYGEARAEDVKRIVTRLQGDKTIRVTLANMRALPTSVIIGFASGQMRSAHSGNLNLRMPWQDC